jgi:PAS domain S-box-containing protein
VAERVDWMLAQLLQTRLAEESLQEAEARYRSIFEATSDGLIILDPDSRIVEVNPALCRMHGYTREELIGWRAWQLHRIRVTMACDQMRQQCTTI